MHPTDDIYEDFAKGVAEQARTKDAAYLDGTPLPGPVTEEVDPLMLIPDWLNRNLPEEQRDAAWQAYCDALGLTVHAPARDIESRAKISTPADERPNLRELSKQEADHKRITKMKVGLQKKAAHASGADKAMPLTGKEALRAIKGE